MKKTAINFRNRPVVRLRKMARGPTAVLIKLTDTCSALEGVSDELLDLDQKRVSRKLSSIVRTLYSACGEVETFAHRDMATPVSRITSPVMQGPAPSSDSSEFMERRRGKKVVNSTKLYVLAKEINWECGDATCAKCPMANPERQRRECLDYYSAERMRLVAFDELAAGVPYTREQLESLERIDLVKLTELLKVNKFHLKDRAVASLVNAVLKAQQEVAS